MEHREINFRVRLPWPTRLSVSSTLSSWLPSRGSIIFTMLMIGLLLWAQTAGALPLPGYLNAPDAPSTSTVAYQGRLADASGNPLTAVVNMEFRLYNAATGGTWLWHEPWTGPNAVQVSDGLFNVMLGSLTPIPQNIMTGNSSLWLGITAGTDDEMIPRVQLGSVPFAVQALTVPDGSVTTPKIADGAVTQAKLGGDVSLIPPDGSITTAKIADGAVTQAKAPSLVKAITSGTVIQYGSASVSASSTTNMIIIDIDFNPDFTSRPQLIVQPAFGYTPIITTAWGNPCDHRMCRVWVTRLDGANWTAGQYQDIDWIAVGR